MKSFDKKFPGNKNHVLELKNTALYKGASNFVLCSLLFDVVYAFYPSSYSFNRAVFFLFRISPSLTVQVISSCCDYF